MTFVNLLLFILIGVGITNIVVNASVLDNIKEWLYKKLWKYEWVEVLLSCMLCSGFWVGFIVSLFFTTNPIFGGAIISLASHFYGNIMYYIDVLTEVENNKFEEIEDAEE